MLRAVILILLASFAAPRTAQAAVLDEFFARGYSIVASTTLPGSFTGCIRQRKLVFADGSIFSCARNTAQTAYEPRVYILRLGSDPPSVILVGSHPLPGELLRLQLHDYPVPLRMNADPLAARPAAPAYALQPIGPIPSIDTLTQQQNAPLSEQQDRVPAHQSKNLPSR